MFIAGVKKSGDYYDSVTLMLLARDLIKMEGVKDAAAVMGTKENLQLLNSSGMMAAELQGAGDTDLLIAVKADDEKIAREAVERAGEMLKENKKRRDEESEHLPRSVEGAVKQMPGANLAIISVAGRWAGGVAADALRRGLHVLLFSDNVTVEKEIELKRSAREKGLLLMGPDCGTAIINGAPLGFANVVPRGAIGIVAASGTGLQEISSIIANEGEGVSQAIGTGGRDVKKEVGGMMFLEGIEALVADLQTRVIVLVSKPPHPDVEAKIAAAVKKIKKPVVAILIGGEGKLLREAGVEIAGNLEEAALLAVARARGQDAAGVRRRLEERKSEIAKRAAELAAGLHPEQKFLRGLFSGGTLCDEVQLLLRGTIGDIFSNTPLTPELKLPDSQVSRGHTVLDLGDDEFTVGRPHPMIDFSLRVRRLLEEARLPETAVVLLDVVLGYGSHLEPAGELAPAIRKALEEANKAGRNLTIICSITGTENDPQQRKKVDKELAAAGAIVMPTNASAALLAGGIVKIAGEKR